MQRLGGVCLRAQLWHTLQDPPVYHLEDRSTNGTAINGARVPKGTSRPLVEGDRVRFAVATQDPNKIIECVLGARDDLEN